jgi:DNA mismatch repair protein MutS
MLIDDYINYCAKYNKIYEKNVVLMQVGSFFELYGIPDENKGAKIQEICNILEIQMTKKKKSNPEVSINNPYMAGIPLFVINKYIDILLSENYTIILIEQVTQPPEPKREVTKIISPSTNIDSNIVQVNNNFLMCIYFTIGNNKKSFLTGSISYVDINTNESFIYECEEEDTKINLEDIYKIILMHRPSEIVFITDITTKIDLKSIEVLNNFIKTLPNCCIHNKLSYDIDENYFKLSYQKCVLNKVFKNTGLLSVIEYLDLERKPLSIISFIYLIQFAYEHSEKILEGLSKPQFIEENKYLSLINNVVENLNILSRDKKGKTSCLLSLLNNCKTSMGKRFFKKALINPLINTEKIKKRYDMIDFFIKDNLYEVIRPFLSKISDLERLFKRLIIKNLQPCEFTMIDSSLLPMVEILKILKEKNFKLKDINYNEELIKFINYYNSKFNLQEMEKVNINQVTKNIFNKNIFPELDKLEKEIIKSENMFEDICNFLNENEKQEFKLEINKENIRSISITKIRFENLKADKIRIKNINNLLSKYNLSFEDIKSEPLSSNNKSYLKIIFKGMYKSQIRLNELHSEFRNMIQVLYFEQLDYFYKEYECFFKNIIQFICELDFFCCNAKNAIENCYSRPILTDSEDSFIKAEKIRHPLIEVIQVDIPYVANDIEIGTENNKGILLYGVNSSGKSSLMKSIGMNIIMAQAGMYVASKTFEYSPYYHIFSRIPSGDDLYKGQSTFVCEINELRTILKRSTNKSLIIGDELCSGTENVSAISLITSGINFLYNKKSSFIFATHLHDLCDIKLIKDLKELNIYHLSVHFDKESNCLIYDRILKKGNGDSLYGLEIAKSLDLPEDFLLYANKVRQDYTNMNKNFVKIKKSRYSRLIFMDTCSLCNRDCEETHHLTEQQYANSKGILEKEQIHKNRKSNLITLCSECHLKIHKNEIKIDGYKQTNKGVKLI